MHFYALFVISCNSLHFVGNYEQISSIILKGKNVSHFSIPNYFSIAGKFSWAVSAVVYQLWFVICDLAPKFSNDANVLQRNPRFFRYLRLSSFDHCQNSDWWPGVRISQQFGFKCPPIWPSLRPPGTNAVYSASALKCPPIWPSGIWPSRLSTLPRSERNWGIHGLVLGDGDIVVFEAINAETGQVGSRPSRGPRGTEVFMLSTGRPRPTI